MQEQSNFINFNEHISKTLLNEFGGSEKKKAVITFDSIKNILEKLSSNGTNINASDTYREYCRRFVIDAFIGTPDRNNSNWGILVNGKTGETRLAPVYDCGASMLPFISDEELACNEGSKDIAATIVSSAVYNKAGEKIQYYSYMLSHDDPELDKAIRDIIPVIDLRKISEIINNIPYISKIRKDFYNSVLKTRYEQILMPALKNQGV